MIPNAEIRDIQSSLVTETAEFGISSKDTAHIMSILRDQLYSDKTLAVLREYGSNAWDAHRDSGKPDLPIEVTLPTSMDPTLRIRDFGTGLSPDDVFKIYTQYGASTKRASDNAVGMLGIGSKSGFAYSDSFSIVSFHAGKKRMYIAVLDATEKGRIDLLHEEDCGDETGVEISLPIKPDDIEEFEEKAKNVFAYFLPRPKINTEIPPLPKAQETLKNGLIYEHSQGYYSRSDWVAVMGCVAYKIDTNQVKSNDSTPEGGIADFVHRISGALYFPIGEVQVSASREELKYSEKTKLALVRRFNALVDEYVQNKLREVQDMGISAWDRRVRMQIFKQLHLPVPTTHLKEAADHLDIKEKLPDGCMITDSLSSTGHRTHIQVDPTLRIIIRDDTREANGFQGLQYGDYFLKVIDQAKLPEAEEALNKLIVELGIEGVPVLKLSSFTWQKVLKRRSTNGRQYNAKHRQRVFTYDASVRFRKPYSNSWDGTDRVMEATDVFVLIKNFEVEGFHMGRRYEDDASLLKVLGSTMPTIYAYKNTEKKPITEADCIGVPYIKWFDDTVTSLITPELKDKCQRWKWSQVFGNTHPSYVPTLTQEHRKTYAKLVKEFTKKHPITKYYLDYMKGLVLFKVDPAFNGGLKLLQDRMPAFFAEGDAEKRTLLLKETYPLLAVRSADRDPYDDGSFIGRLWREGPNTDLWVNYVKMVDEHAKYTVHDDQRIDHRDSEGEESRSEEGGSPIQCTT